MSSSENYVSSSKCAGNGQMKIDDITLKPCHVCGRTFNFHSLERHVKICEKSKKVIRRNVFNSFSQRAKDLGATSVVNDAKEEEKRKCKRGKEKCSENNLHVMMGDRCSNSNIMNNGLSQHKKIPAGYQQCPSCNRYFNEKAAERHIAWCTEQQTRLPKTPPSSQALERLKARIKYKAPLPKRKLNSDLNIRLVKSAESIRESSLMRTHSSPQIPIHSLRTSRSKIETHFNEPSMKSDSPVKIKNSPMCSKIKNNEEQISNDSVEYQNKKAVKFKEIFPVYKKERNKNLDMLAALRIRLSQLETSDNLLDDCFMKPNENELFHNRSKSCNFPMATSGPKELRASDSGDHCKTTSGSDDSLPPVNHAGIPEQRMPRFCYNCGTKYPIVSAKFCCECGARRFILGVNNGQLYAV